MASCRVKVQALPGKLPCHSLDLPQLVIGPNTKYLDVESLNDNDYKNWLLQIHPQKIIQGHHLEHKFWCRFIFDLYLEFVDRQYLKNIGYRRSSGGASEIEGWDSLYWSYLNTDCVFNDFWLDHVLLDAKIVDFPEAQDRSGIPAVTEKDLKDYKGDSKDQFLGYIEA